MGEVRGFQRISHEIAPFIMYAAMWRDKSHTWEFRVKRKMERDWRKANSR
jgi:hypothetical protein